MNSAGFRICCCFNDFNVVGGIAAVVIGVDDGVAVVAIALGGVVVQRDAEDRF